MMSSTMSPRATMTETKQNQEIVRRIVKNVIRDAEAHCKQAKRKTVTMKDVVYALKTYKENQHPALFRANT